MKKRVFTILLTFMMALSFMPMLGHIWEAYAGTGGHTQADAVAWAEGKANAGQTVGTGQCVALIKAYYEYLGNSSVSGHATDYQSNALPNGWQRIANYNGFVPQAGDIAVWAAYSKLNPYYTLDEHGHIGIVRNGTSTTFNSVEQNVSGLYPQYCNDRPTNLVACWIRPDFNSTPPPTPQGSQTIPDGRYQIVSQADTNKIMDVYGTSTTDGANVHLYSSRSDGRQTWNVTYLNDGSYKIVNYNSGKALDVDGGLNTNGSNVHQYTWHSDNAQKWVIRANVDGSFSLEPQCAAGKYLEVQGGYTSDGTNIQIWDKNDTSAQKFYFVEWAGQTIPDGRYQIVSQLDNSKQLDVYGTSTTDGANVHLFNSRSDSRQTWGITYLGDGSYKIINNNSGKALDADNGGTTKGTNVQQYKWTGDNAQKWSISANSDGSYSISSWKSGKRIDVYSGNTANGTNIQLWDKNDTSSQRFFIVDWAGKTIPNGRYSIVTKLDSTKNLDVYGTSQSDGANVQIFATVNDPRQTWNVEYLGDGSYKITNYNSGKVLDADNGGTANGTNVQQYRWTGDSAQKWVITENTDGSYSIASWKGGGRVDVKDFGTANGTNVQLFQKCDNDAQKFYFVEWKEPHTHNLINTPAKAPTTTVDGNIEYWTCSGCGNYFKDSEGKTEISKADTIIPKLSPTEPSTPTPPTEPTNPEDSSVTPVAPSEIVDLPAVKITSAKSAKKAAVVKWKKVSKKNQKKIAKIQIQYSTDGTFKTGVKTVTAKKSATSKKIKNLKSKKHYYFRIRSYKKDNGVVHVSKWSKIKRAKIK